MRILATLALFGIVFASPVFSAKAIAQRALNQDAEQKSKSEPNTIEDKIISVNDNFIASSYVPEINPKKLAYFEQWRKKVMEWELMFVRTAAERSKETTLTSIWKPKNRLSLSGEEIS